MILALIIALFIAIILAVYLVVKNKRLLRHTKHLELMLNNLHTYSFLMNESYEIISTNYYAINPNSPHPNAHFLGNIIRCKNAYDYGKCGSSPNCGNCEIKRYIRKALETNSNFSEQEAHLILYTVDHEIIEKDVSIYGSIVNGNNKSHYLVIEIKDITQLKISQEKFANKNVSEKEAEKKYRKVINKLNDEISASLKTMVNFTQMLSNAQSSKDISTFQKLLKSQADLILKWFKTHIEEKAESFSQKPQPTVIISTSDINIYYTLSQKLKGFYKTIYTENEDDLIAAMLNNQSISGIILNTDEGKIDLSNIFMAIDTASNPILVFIITNKNEMGSQNLFEKVTAYIPSDISREELLKTLAQTGI